MSLEQTLLSRAAGHCELCNAAEPLQVYEAEKAVYSDENSSMAICSTCAAQLNKKAELDPAHWQYLGTSMWSEVPGIQVTAWRMLNRLRQESWAADLLDQLYLDDDNLAWAKATGDHENDGSVVLHRDAFGAVLQHGDNVVLTKSLDVKGSTLNAKMGTVVRNIRLVEGNTEQIEGRIEGQLIVILTKYLRKQH